MKFKRKTLNSCNEIVNQYAVKKIQFIVNRLTVKKHNQVLPCVNQVDTLINDIKKY